MKKRVKVKPVWLILVQQVGLILLISLALCAAGAALVLGGIIPQDKIGVTGLLCLGVGTLAGCWLAARSEPKGKLLRVGILTGITALLLLFGNLLFVHEAPSGWLRVITALLVGGTLAILTAFGRKKRAGKRR